MTLHSKHRADIKQEHETPVFQKKRYEMQTYKNPFEQNNDHTRIMHEMQCLRSFKDAFIKKMQKYGKGHFLFLLKIQGPVLTWPSGW